MGIYVILDLMYKIGNDWDNILNEVSFSYLKDILNKVKYEYETKVIYPKYTDIFNAFKLTSYKDIKVVILGQDPYHNKDEAHGLSFSVQCKKLPPSLKNIYKELETNIGIKNEIGNLTSWANQGVFLLNSILTVEEHKPSSHKSLGWNNFTDDIIKLINQKTTPVVFVLWGNFALTKKDLITNPKHLILTSSHPSPFSARVSFFGSDVFNNINEFLTTTNQTPIDWRIKYDN